MSAISYKPISNELKKDLYRPRRLPLSILIASGGTFLLIAIGSLIHTLSRGLPYVSAEIFIWSLATYNAAQLASDPDNVISYANRRQSLRNLFIVKNLTMFILAFPINILFVAIACLIIGDWSKFGASLVLAISAVIICLGVGNIVSVLWVYKPMSFLKMKRTRRSLIEYSIFIILSFGSASVALVLATIPATLVLNNLNLDLAPGVILGLIIMIIWTVSVWIFCLVVADKLALKYKDVVLRRLNGEPFKVKNHYLKKLIGS